MIPFLTVTVQEIPEQLPEVDLPGGVAPFMRAFFSVPQGVQMAGGIVAAVVALVLLVVIVRKRAPLIAWFRSRNRALQLGLAAVALVAVSLVAAGSAVSWDYMQHDNDFCTGCHVMEDAYRRFTLSEHAELSCHDCHRQSIFASMRQLHLWVRDRPEEIGEHAPVPTPVCLECHSTREPEERWERIRETAGHIAHLESDSAALANVQCVTCHGMEVHAFRPADQTCGQTACHESEATRIQLGAMAEQTGFHCVTCHEFTADPVAGAAPDTAAERMAGAVATSPAGGLLTPGLRQCFSCHEMEDLWAQYDPLVDPHDAKCGTCHNPHVQDLPEAALTSCTDAGCHARPDTLSTLHVGLGEAVEEDCTGCHEPHMWVRDGNDCAACHIDILGGRAIRSGPAGEGPGYAVGRRAPSGATREVRGSTDSKPASIYHHGGLAGPPARGPSDPFLGASHTGPVARASAPVTTFDAPAPFQQAFTHDQHRSVECTECHSNRRRHGEVEVRTQSDCFSCHHSVRTGAQSCGDCHTRQALGRERQVSTTLHLSVWESERVRRLPFDHDEHAQLRCVDCHGGDIRQRVQNRCADCHQDHHRADAGARCVACHEEHRTDAHTATVHETGCTGSGCHAQPEYPRMQPTRSFCTSCHQDMIDHEPSETCVECHLVPTDEPPGAAGLEPR